MIIKMLLTSLSYIAKVHHGPLFIISIVIRKSIRALLSLQHGGVLPYVHVESKRRPEQCNRGMECEVLSPQLGVNYATDKQIRPYNASI